MQMLLRMVQRETLWRGRYSRYSRYRYSRLEARYSAGRQVGAEGGGLPYAAYRMLGCGGLTLPTLGTVH